MTTKQVQVVRPFCIDGQRQEVGTVVEVSRVLAAELIHGGKAVAVVAKPDAAAAKPRKEKTE